MAWTVYTLGSDFPTTNSAAQQPTGLLFTPEASKRYWVRFNGLIRSSANNVAPWVGFNWPSGIGYSSGWMRVPPSVTGIPDPRFWGPVANTATAGTTFTTGATTSWLAHGNVAFETGGAPSGDFEVTLRVENAGSATVTLKAGSQLWVWEY